MNLPTGLIENANKMNEMINRQNTGCCDAFANKLYLGKETTKNYINQIREILEKYAVVINYDCLRKTYLYYPQGNLKIEVKISWEPESI